MIDIDKVGDVIRLSNRRFVDTRLWSDLPETAREFYRDCARAAVTEIDRQLLPQV